MHAVSPDFRNTNKRQFVLELCKRFLDTVKVFIETVKFQWKSDGMPITTLFRLSKVAYDIIRNGYGCTQGKVALPTLQLQRW